MNRTLLLDAFAHHSWATVRLLDACAGLTEDQLATSVPGTYGSVIDTLRHLVSSDRSYLGLLAPSDLAELEEDSGTVAELRAAMVEDGTAWAALVSGDLDPDAAVVRQRDDGSTSSAPLTIRLTQVIHHGTDHRSQVCTALTALGIEPPAIDAWDFADQDGRLVQTPPTS